MWLNLCEKNCVWNVNSACGLRLPAVIMVVLLSLCWRRSQWSIVAQCSVEQVKCIMSRLLPTHTALRLISLSLEQGAFSFRCYGGDSRRALFSAIKSRIQLGNQFKIAGNPRGVTKPTASWNVFGASKISGGDGRCGINKIVGSN